MFRATRPPRPSKMDSTTFKKTYFGSWSSSTSGYTGTQSTAPLTVLSKTEAAEDGCPICQDSIVWPTRLPCAGAHAMCVGCAQTCFDEIGKNTCPCCREVMFELHDGVARDFGVSFSGRTFWPATTRPPRPAALDSTHVLRMWLADLPEPRPRVSPPEHLMMREVEIAGRVVNVRTFEPIGGNMPISEEEELLGDDDDDDDELEATNTTAEAELPIPDRSFWNIGGPSEGATGVSRELRAEATRGLGYDVFEYEEQQQQCEDSALAQESQGPSQGLVVTEGMTPQSTEEEHWVETQDMSWLEDASAAAKALAERR